MTIYLIHGPNDFVGTQKMQELCADREVFVCRDKKDLPQAKEVGGQQGLFSESKLVVLEDMVAHLGVEWFDSFSGGEIILWERGSLDKRKKITKWLLKNATVFECKEKDQREMNAWVKDQGYAVDYPMLQALWQRYGSNMWAWRNELEKLALFLGEDTKIGASHMDLLSERTTEESIFELTDYFGDRLHQKALIQYQNLLDQRVDPFYVHAMVARHIRLLLLAGEPDGLKGQHPFVAKKITKQRSQWTTDMLIKKHSDATNLDFDVKSGKIDMESGMAKLLLT